MSLRLLDAGKFCLAKCLNYFSTTTRLSKTNPEWKEMVRKRRQWQERRTKARLKANPFASNVGMSNQLQAAGFLDPEDPVFVDHREDIRLEHNLDTVSSLDRISRKRTEMAVPGLASGTEDRMRLRRIVTKKRFLPDPRPPNMLTFLEKEMMRKLHADDPAEWSVDRLAECFPVPPRAVAAILRNKKKLRPDSIRRHDEGVRDNWRLLLKGKLANSEEIVEHMERSHGKEFRPLFSSPAERQELEQEVLRDYAAGLEPRRPDLSGEFGRILAAYNRKVEDLLLAAAKDAEEEPNVVPVVGDVPLVVDRLLDDQADFRDSLNLPSVYGETTLVNSADRKKKTRLDRSHVTVDTFRKMFLAELAEKKRKEEEGGSRPAAKFFDWLEKDNEERDRVAGNPTTRVDVGQIVGRSGRSRPTSRKGKRTS